MHARAALNSRIIFEFHVLNRTQLRGFVRPTHKRHFNYTIDASGPSPKGAGWSDDYPNGNVVQGTILYVTLLHFSDTNHL